MEKEVKEIFDNNVEVVVDDTTKEDSQISESEEIEKVMTEELDSQLEDEIYEEEYE